MQVRSELIADLKRDEGMRLKAYPDPLTGGAPWTIGYGHTGPEVHPELVWTQKQCSDMLLKDASKHAAEVLAALPWAAALDPVRQDVLFNMAFNLGLKGLLGFKNSLARIERGDYAIAAANMRKSLWARQVRNRAKRLADMIQTGRRDHGLG